MYVSNWSTVALRGVTRERVHAFELVDHDCERHAEAVHGGANVEEAGIDVELVAVDRAGSTERLDPAA